MMSPKKLLKVARKWEISAASGRKRIALAGARVESNSTSSVTEKGHFIIYTADGSRFMVPLQCLSSNIFLELFKMSEEEFGLSSDGPITMPCDAASMDYIVSLVKRGIAKDIEKALLNSIAFYRCSAASLHHECVEGVLVCGQ
ncbi:auxin-responsive protein SAUR68-like [Syzygium oleosum]|uniref:auxin-responsive protein SAUR68-like n=1 Tax=Syzygium oleosum TaxID=219896 RepID=UPI0011D273D6|nr:auxin-responsive protein SAUR68-like [Syzygium oleosum]